MITEWNPANDLWRSIFNAALSGICANPEFFGMLFQQSPQAAVEFANECVLVVMNGKSYVPPHARVAAPPARED